MSDDSLSLIAPNSRTCRPRSRVSVQVRLSPASDLRQLALYRFLWGPPCSSTTAARQRALNLTRGRDNIWRGRCPVCGYAAKFELAGSRIVLPSPAARVVPMPASLP
jgi:hypothetical protein